MWGLIGNEAAITLLQQGLELDRLAQAYLLVGPSGIGKGALALALAKALNCQGQDPPCGVCSQCRRIAAGLHPDIAVLALGEGQRELSIDRVRELQRALSLRPFEGRCRVAIVREADRLSHEAANALLKTLEEPPPEVVLLLTTREEAAILSTIRSRCRRIALRPVPQSELAETLQRDYGLGGDQAVSLATFARGSPGHALAALHEPGILSAVGASLAQLKALLESDTAGRLDQAQQIAPQDRGQREAAAQRLRHWRDWWRDLLLLKAGCHEGLAFLQETSDYQRYGDVELPEVREAIASIERALQQLEQNANPRLVLDVLALSLPLSGLDRQPNVPESSPGRP